MQKVITAETEEKIRDMRSCGKGYRVIATKTGLKVDTIKKYCQRNGIGGYLGGVDKCGG